MKSILKRLKIKLISRRHLKSKSEDINLFISALKKAGATPRETINIIVEKLGIDRWEAKEITFNSPSWNYLIADENPFVQDFLDLSAEEADSVEYDADGKVISVTFNLADLDSLENEVKIKEARIYVDFNEMIEDDLVLLSQTDFKKDSMGNMVELTEGLKVKIYMSDSDEFGIEDNLIAEGTVELNTYGGWTQAAKWNCRIDINGIYHESDGLK